MFCVLIWVMVIVTVYIGKNHPIHSDLCIFSSYNLIESKKKIQLRLVLPSFELRVNKTVPQVFFCILFSIMSRKFIPMVEYVAVHSFLWPTVLNGICMPQFIYSFCFLFCFWPRHMWNLILVP